MADRVKDHVAAQDRASHVSPELIQKHFRKIHDLATELKELSAELNTAFKTAKSDGVPIDALKMARKLHKMDSLKAQQLLNQVAHIGRVLGMPFATQLSMFGQPADTAVSAEAAQEQRNFDAMETGRACGRDGGSKTLNPYEPGTEEHTFWLKGWGAGDEARFKAAKATGTDVKKPRAKKAATRVTGENGAPLLQ
jgi:uncharacterized protein (UPF0335 family)/ribosome modulation factor